MLGARHNALKLKGANNRAGPSAPAIPAVTKPPIPFRTVLPAAQNLVGKEVLMCKCCMSPTLRSVTKVFVTISTFLNTQYSDVFGE